MTFKRWIRKIVLFPLSIIMAVPDGDDTTAGEDSGPSLHSRIMGFAGDSSEFLLPQDGPASEGDDLDADQDTNPGDKTEDGLVTASDEDDSAAELEEVDADETTSQETPEGGEGTKKKTFEERMAEMEAKIRADLTAEFEAKRNADKKPAEPDYIEVDVERVNKYISETEDKIEELKQAGEQLEAKRLEKSLQKTLDDLEANEQRKIAFLAKQETDKKAKESNSTIINARLEKLDKAAEFFRDKMKIEKPVWDKMGEWFAKACQDDPILGAEFTEKVEQGEVGAVKFAHDYTSKHMGQKAQQSTEKKEQLKTQTAKLTTASTGSGGKTDIKALKAAFDANPSDENFHLYQDAKRRLKAA